jgi:hypothetical protein
MWHGWLEQGNHMVRMVGARQLFGWAVGARKSYVWGGWSKVVLWLGWLQQGNPVDEGCWSNVFL